MASDQENSEIGFRDLLLNSAIGCMLLFIIFSIRIGGNSIQTQNVSGKQHADYKFMDHHSLIVDNAVKSGLYKSIVVVEIKDVSPREYIDAFGNDVAKWSVDANETPRFMCYHNGTLAYYLVLTGLPAPTISWSVPSNPFFRGLYTVTAKIVDGKANLQKERVENVFSREWHGVSLSDREVVFRSARDEDNNMDTNEPFFDLR